jgi:hypothetical protein
MRYINEVYIHTYIHIYIYVSMNENEGSNRNWQAFFKKVKWSYISYKRGTENKVYKVIEL